MPRTERACLSVSLRCRHLDHASFNTERTQLGKHGGFVSVRRQSHKTNSFSFGAAFLLGERV
jgi:hypothetical protein